MKKAIKMQCFLMLLFGYAVNASGAELISDVYKAEKMSVEEIITKAKECVAENGGKITIESDISITVKAKVYVKRYWVDVPYDSTMTIKVREGRFKIKHTQVDVAYEDDREKVSVALDGLNTKIAECIKTSDEW